MLVVLDIDRAGPFTRRSSSALPGHGSLDIVPEFRPGQGQADREGAATVEVAHVDLTLMCFDYPSSYRESETSAATTGGARGLAPKRSLEHST